MFRTKINSLQESNTVVSIRIYQPTRTNTPEISDLLTPVFPFRHVPSWSDDLIWHRTNFLSPFTRKLTQVLYPHRCLRVWLRGGSGRSVPSRESWSWRCGIWLLWVYRPDRKAPGHTLRIGRLGLPCCEARRTSGALPSSTQPPGCWGWWRWWWGWRVRCCCLYSWMCLQYSKSNII